jgi:hypothetical protein
MYRAITNSNSDGLTWKLEIFSMTAAGGSLEMSMEGGPARRNLLDGVGILNSQPLLLKVFPARSLLSDSVWWRG